MVLIHTQEYFLNHDLANPWLEGLVDFLGGIPAAPVFMFLMGVGWVYSRRSTPQVLLKRGLLLLGTGYMLSFARGVMPSLLHFSVLGDGYYLNDALQKFLYVDILQFSGLAILFYSGIKALDLGPRAIGFLTLALIGVNGLLTSLLKAVVLPNNWLFDHLMGLFVGYGDLSFFPFLTWIVYPLLGYLFGYALVRSTNHQLFYTVSGMGGGLVFFGLTFLLDEVVGYDNLLYSYTEYYHHQGLENLIATGFVLLMIGLCYWAQKVLPKVVEEPLLRWSANVTDIYFVHWVILGWLVAFMGYNTLSTPYYLALVVLVMWISDRMSERRGKV